MTMMLARVAAFEFRYQLKSPIFIAMAAAFFLLRFAGMSLGNLSIGGGDNVLLNSPHAMIEAHLFMSLAFMFVSAALVSTVIVRDIETGFGPIIRSTDIGKADYLFGRFLGAFGVGALVMAMIPLGSWLGTLMPTAATEMLGRNAVRSFLQPFLLFGLPNALTVAAILFALATVTRSMAGTFVGVVGIIACYVASQAFLAGQPQLLGVRSLADPFGLGAYQIASRYATAAELNAGLMPLTAPLLWSRLLWAGISVGLLALAYSLFRFSEPGLSPRQSRKAARALQVNRASGAASADTAPVKLPKPLFASGTARAQFAARAKMEAQHISGSPALAILLFIVLVQTFLGLWFSEGQFGQRPYPLAASLIPLILENFQLLIAIIAIFFGGELVWRERERRLHEIVGASPLPSWALMLPKVLGLTSVLCAVVLAGMAVGLLVQLMRGGAPLELDKYLLWYLLPASADAALIAVLSVFVSALSPSKFAGWGVMALYLVTYLFGSRLGLDHHLLVYGRVPTVPVSDLNGLGIYWQAAWWFRLFWGAAAILLLLAVHLLWPRGNETRLVPQLRRVPARMKGSAGLVAGVAATIFLLSGGWIVYNTLILNDHSTGTGRDRAQAEFERRFVRYADLPQPTVRHVELDVALYPDEIRAEVRGRYRIVNETRSPIDRVHVHLLDGQTELVGISLPGARLEQNDRDFGYRIYRFDVAMQPGERRSLAFQTRRQQLGFRSSGADERLVPNGIDLNSFALAPRIGMNRENLVSDPAKRRAYGLPPAPAMPRLEDQSATSRNVGNASWTTADIIVSTSADQLPIAPGRKVLETTQAGRRTARFVSEAPILDFFSIQSGRYAVRTANHRGVELSVYHHPEHHWNIERMLRAMRASLDHYQRAFGPYQFDQARIIESPSYREGGQAFANTIPYSETAAFTLDFRDPAAIDILTFGTAHELSHQWWGHQVAAANVQGSAMLIETLAQYSALMVMEKLEGEHSVRRFLHFQLDRYLSRRRTDTGGEMPLARVEDQPHIAYGKGAVAMYLLQERMGEEAVNRALRAFVERFRFRGPPYPRSLDLISFLRREAATADQQALITDLFERITFYDLRVEQPTAQRRSDGKWEVSVPVQAVKSYSDSRGGEQQAPLLEPMAVGLFTADPGTAAFSAADVITIEPRRIRSGHQVIRLTTDRRPTHAGIDPYNFHIDRNSADNIAPLR